MLIHNLGWINKADAYFKSISKVFLFAYDLGQNFDMFNEIFRICEMDSTIIGKAGQIIN